MTLKTRIQQAITNQGDDPATLAVDAIEPTNRDKLIDAINEMTKAAQKKRGMTASVKQNSYLRGRVEATKDVRDLIKRTYPADQGQAEGFDEWWDTEDFYNSWIDLSDFTYEGVTVDYGGKRIYATEPSDQGQARVEVKPLDWEAKIAHPKSYHDSGGWTRHANTPFGCYTINYFKSGKPLYLVEYRGCNIAKGQPIKNEEAAKAAAQAHHEAAVRSMIVGA